MIVDIPPGVSIGELHAHEGEESHVVIKGTILAEQGEESFVIHEGDSFSWNASVPHYVKNIGEDNATIFISIYSETELKDLL